jgi:signal transduction histidine kinase
MADYHALLENADAMFREYEFAGKLSEPFYGRYEDAVNRLRAGVEELVRYEKTEVDHAQAEALHVIQRSREAVIFLALLSVVLALLAGFVLSRAISGPVSRLRSASAEISRGEFDVEIPTQSKDEIGDLGRSISQMAQELKKRHEELEESNAVLARQAAELETANKTQADFMAMIVHDLRAPMSNVVGVATMMEDGYMGSLTDEQRKWIGKIKSNTDNLVALVNDYLDVSKLEAGRIDLSRGQVDLNVLLRNTIENFAPLATDKRISLTSGTDVSLPAIQADARRLEQVLNNLLSNALKFTPEGGEIELGASADGAEAKIWVKDAGVGIASEELGRVFEKYRQSASGKISNHKGTGLGLVICKMIVEAHGGKIWGESEEGEGTKFTFTMPLDQGKNRSVGEKIEESCADA